MKLVQYIKFTYQLFIFKSVVKKLIPILSFVRFFDLLELNNSAAEMSPLAEKIANRAFRYK